MTCHLPYSSNDDFTFLRKMWWFRSHAQNRTASTPYFKVALKINALLGLDAGLVGMLYFAHFRHQVGRGNQLFRCVASRDDDRGTLTAIEDTMLPFAIRRVFYMHRVPGGGERGAHAHRYTQQGIIAAAGRFMLDVSDGGRTETFVLNDPNRCLYLPAMTWTRLYAFEASTVALVLCDTNYRPEHVVRDWDEFQRLVRQTSLAASAEASAPKA